MLFLPSSSSLSRTLRASPPCGRGSVPQILPTKPLQHPEKEAGPPSLASPGQPQKQCQYRSQLQASRLQQARLHHLPRRRAQRRPLQMSQSKHHQLRQQLPTAAIAPPEPEGPPPGFENPITAPSQRKGRKLTVVQVECDKCQSLVLRGMTHCDVCSAELASNTELPEETVTRLSVLRRQQLARAGLARTESPVSDYINAGLSLRVVSASGRGNMSPEAIMIQDARSRMKRADKCGFQSIEDRFEHDVHFMERMLQMGYDYRAAQRQDGLCHVHLANPPRNKAQVSLGLGYDEDHSLARLAYIDVAPDRFPQAMDYIPEQWCVIYRTNILSLREYAEYINSPKSHRGLLAWDGVHHVQQDSALEERQLCHDNLSAARRDVVNKQTQEQRQQQGKGKRKSSTGGDETPASKAKGAPPPSPVSPRASGSASSLWGWSSWNSSEWGEQRQWDRRSQDWSSSQSWWHRR